MDSRVYKIPFRKREQKYKAISGFSSVGRAFDCSGKQTSDSRWFDPGKPDTNLIGQGLHDPLV